MIGADVSPILFNQENPRCAFPNMRTSVMTIFGCAKLRQFCRSLAQIILNTRFSTAPKNTTSSWPANSSACIALPLRRSTVFLSSGFCCDLCDHGEHPGDRAWLSPRYRSWHGPLAMRAPLTREGAKERRDQGRPDQPHWGLISIDYIDMM